jgi:hypothetical protein
LRQLAASAAAVQTTTPEQWRRMKEANEKRNAQVIAEAAAKKAAEEKSRLTIAKEEKAKLDRQLAELVSKRAALQVQYPELRTPAFRP